MVDLIYFFILMSVGYIVGTLVEKNHYRSLKMREKEFLNLPAVTAEHFAEPDKVIENAELVCGNVVIGTDYFKLVLSGLRNIWGGEVSAYETLLDRARREAILRMKDKAKGADLILNLRLETCQINQLGNSEVLAYGTAVYYKK